MILLPGKAMRYPRREYQIISSDTVWVDHKVYVIVDHKAYKKYGVAGSWTQGLVHAKHALYQLSYNPVVIPAFRVRSYTTSNTSIFNHIFQSPYTYHFKLLTSNIENV